MKALAGQINELDSIDIYGRVVGVRGLMVEVAGPPSCDVGRRARRDLNAGQEYPCEVVGSSNNNALLMSFAPLEGVRRGCRALVTSVAGAVRPSAGWPDRVVNALGEPIDGKGALLLGPSPYPFRNTPPPAHARRRVGGPLDLGVRALNTFITCCRGQRMGIFPAPASASPCRCRCWRVTAPPTSS
jgi:flagellum-specific ATP synthase